MKVDRIEPADAERAHGVVVVIDVIRAFSVAAYALAGGATRLWLVRTEGEALALRVAEPTALLAGEVKGRLISGFDLNNSPARMAAANVRGRTIIQRTGAGTQGAVAAVNASHLLVCSLVNARATALAAACASSQADTIFLMPTGGRESPEMIEDGICADYLEALLEHPESARTTLDSGLERLRASGRLDVFTAHDADFPADDVPHFMAADRFDFAMAGTHRTYAGVRYVEVVRAEVPPNLGGPVS